MFRLLNDIGWAAGRVYGHAHLLTIDGDDSDHAGSAVLDEEKDEKDEPHIADQDDRLDDDDLDDQPRGRRTDKSAKAYDDLKSERDRLKAENDKKDRLLQDVTGRLERLEQGRETRDAVNIRTNEAKERARQRAREVVDEISKIPADDPERSRKVYEHLFETMYQDQAAAAEEISRRTSSEVVQETRTREQLYEDARKATVAALEDAGLGEEAFELVQAMSVMKRQHDPDWFRRTPDEEQIPSLVNLVKEKIIKYARGSKEFKDDKRRHREDMDGVIGEGSRGKRAARSEEDRGTQEGPGSMLADLSRLKKTQRHNTNLMLRQGER